MAGVPGLEPGLAVLETAALPIKLYPCMQAILLAICILSSCFDKVNTNFPYNLRVYLL